MEQGKLKILEKMLAGNQRLCESLLVSRKSTKTTKTMKATQQQLDTLRNISAVAEREGFAESAKCGFTTYSKAQTGQAEQEEVNARIHGIREIIRTAKGSMFADAIA